MREERGRRTDPVRCGKEVLLPPGEMVCVPVCVALRLVSTAKLQSGQVERRHAVSNVRAGRDEAEEREGPSEVRSRRRSISRGS